MNRFTKFDIKVILGAIGFLILAILITIMILTGVIYIIDMFTAHSMSEYFHLTPLKFSVTAAGIITLIKVFFGR